MKNFVRALLAAACCAMLTNSPPAVGDDDHKAASGQAAEPTLNSEQQRAVGIIVAHPLAAKTPQRIEALGLVLDPTALIAEIGETSAASVAEQSASAELARLHELYKGGAGASLKMLEAAQSEQAKALAESRSAAARFALHWGPVAGLPAGARQKLLQDATIGQSLLLRADLPGRHSLGELPSTALLDVDGIQVPGHVLGMLRQSTALQSVGLLIQVSNAPAGLGPGAHLPVVLVTAERSGLLLPRDAILYDESGPYVYKQLAAKPSEGKTRYSPVKVSLLAPYGDAWLVNGVDDDDDIVVHGVGVLWSLQRVGVHAVDDDD